jgi:hypothetical protein
MNSRLPKWMVLYVARPTSVGLWPLAMKESFSEGTIRMSRGKARCKSYFMVSQLLVLFAPVRYRVIKIVHSYSEVVLQTTKHTIFYPSSVPFVEVIALCPAD